jgi:hypothetical protein
MGFLKRRRETQHEPAAAIGEQDVDVSPGSVTALQQSFEQACPLLKLRLWRVEDVGDVPGLYRDVADGLRAVVCLDLPDRIQAIEAGDVDRWERPAAELFALAEHNVRSEPGAFERREHDLGEGVRLTSFSSDSFFGATRVLWPGDLEKEIGEHGAVVAVPTRHTVLVYPIRGAGVRRAANGTLRFAGLIHDEGPGSLSRDIYWCKDGELMTQAAVTLDDGSLALGVQPAFAELLGTLEGGAA